MPFLEVFAFDDAYRKRERLSAALTEALAASYAIGPDIITAYYFRIEPHDYAHAGRQAPPSGEQRMFIKLHAFRRDVKLRREAARRLTEATVSVTGLHPKNVIIYFLERESDEVAHAGTLASD